MKSSNILIPLAVGSGVTATAIFLFEKAKEQQAKLEEFIKDTYTVSEGLVHTYNYRYLGAWILWPNINQGNNPNGRTKFLPWGVLSKERTHDVSTNTRVQLRNMKTYFLIDGKWVLFQVTSNFQEQMNYMAEDGVWPDDMVTRPVNPGEKRQESEGYSYFPEGEWLIHWWARDSQDINKNGRILLPPQYDGIFITIEARLIMDDPMKPSDIDDAKYVLILGGDYYEPYDPNPSPCNQYANQMDCEANGCFWWSSGCHSIPDDPPRGFATGRGKYITKDWRNSYRVISLLEDDIRLNPPPLD